MVCVRDEALVIGPAHERKSLGAESRAGGLGDIVLKVILLEHDRNHINPMRFRRFIGVYGSSWLSYCYFWLVFEL